MVQVPSARVPRVQELPERFPATLQVTFVEPDFVAVTVTVPRTAVATTVIEGVLSFVMLSVLEVPESEAEARSGTPAFPGAVVSMVTESAVEVVEVFPAAS